MWWILTLQCHETETALVTRDIAKQARESIHMTNNFAWFDVSYLGSGLKTSCVLGLDWSWTPGVQKIRYLFIENPFNLILQFRVMKGKVMQKIKIKAFPRYTLFLASVSENSFIVQEDEHYKGYVGKHRAMMHIWRKNMR